ncbi:hypothetical protein EXIGLDRAFT_761806 [Exidia glandulosa HHB12029]|uniref:Uncharacterized protein n=1 Tax=Exidia glandulosa HHB12029 TaxID=1314781 RepID=A0A165N4B3_EXIGL|nr:hypothetical protein EXIGLDRAFT_761806 [Exidia glandulosa HHB12029]
MFRFHKGLLVVCADQNQHYIFTLPQSLESAALQSVLSWESTLELAKSQATVFVSGASNDRLSWAENRSFVYSSNEGSVEVLMLQPGFAQIPPNLRFPPDGVNPGVLRQGLDTTLLAEWDAYPPDSKVFIVPAGAASEVSLGTLCEDCMTIVALRLGLHSDETDTIEVLSPTRGDGPLHPFLVVGLDSAQCRNLIRLPILVHEAFPERAFFIYAYESAYSKFIGVLHGFDNTRLGEGNVAQVADIIGEAIRQSSEIASIVGAYHEQVEDGVDGMDYLSVFVEHADDAGHNCWIVRCDYPTHDPTGYYLLRDAICALRFDSHDFGTAAMGGPVGATRNNDGEWEPDRCTLCFAFSHVADVCPLPRRIMGWQAAHGPIPRTPSILGSDAGDDDSNAAGHSV